MTHLPLHRVRGTEKVVGRAPRRTMFEIASPEVGNRGMGKVNFSRSLRKLTAAGRARECHPSAAGRGRSWYGTVRGMRPASYTCRGWEVITVREKGILFNENHSVCNLEDAFANESRIKMKIPGKLWKIRRISTSHC